MRQFKSIGKRWKITNWHKIGLIASCLIIITLFFSGCHSEESSNLIQVTGTIESRESYINPRVSGRVLRIMVEEGQEVKPGDPLAELDHEYLDLQLKEAQASLAQAQAQLELLLQGARKEDLEQAEQQLKQAEVNFTQAKKDAERFINLWEKGSVTKKQKEDAVNYLSLAQAQYAQAQENLKKLKNLARPEEIKAAKAQVARIEAGVEILKKNIADCLVLSPIRGVVTERTVEPGELISPQTSVVTISRLDPVELWVYIGEKDVGRIKLGQKAEVKIDAFPDKSFYGKVIYISPEAEFTPKNIQTKEDRVKLVFKVKIELPNPEGWLKPGLPADAYLKVQ